MAVWKFRSVYKQVKEDVHFIVLNTLFEIVKILNTVKPV